MGIVDNGLDGIEDLHSSFHSATCCMRLAVGIHTPFSRSMASRKQSNSFRSFNRPKVALSQPLMARETLD
jgi:hypothetical protein